MKPSEGQVDLYLSLDEALDTRMGTLDLINPDVAARVIGENYHGRISDTFAGVDPAEFKARYAARDAETLQRSCASEVYKLVRRLAEGIAAQMTERPYYKSAKIVVNYYPYNIAPTVLEDLQKALTIWFGNSLPIQLVNWPIEVLTPEKCKKEFGALIMYNPQDWLNYHMPALERNPMPEVFMLSPQIHHVAEPTKEEMVKLVEQGATPFLAFEMLMRPLVSLDLVEAHYFSIFQADGI